MIEITPELIAQVIKEWHEDYLSYIESYDLSDSLKPHIDTLVDKFCERLEINREEW